MAKKEKSSLLVASFLQSLGLISYIALVSTIFWKGDEWFGKMDNYLGPLAFLTLFSVSALICGFIVFGYPITLFFVRNMKKEAIRIVVYTAVWTVSFLILLLAFTVSR